MEPSVRLVNEDLWTKFHENTTEMVVTKTGRKMFPKLEYSIEGLKASQAYGLVLQIEQIDENRYKFSGGEWSAAGRGENGGVAKNVMHHDGVMPGAHWMRQAVNFERVKITNNPNDTNPSHVGFKF
ncbi:T-box [Necator americanus]|uniref:T-box n=1 Tax=Necator americanus TaxID=51031 RepID=W2T385_NECAM|nr:T-box [Necator americanus]ETN76470.1 T-box [Necator americanus]